MKAIVCESLRYNLKYGVPLETQSSTSLVGGILSSNTGNDDFRRRLLAAKLIFDVEKFHPVREYDDEEYSAQQKLINKLQNKTAQYDPDNISWFMDSSCRDADEKVTFQRILEAISPLHSEKANEISLILCNDPFYTQQFLCHMNPDSPEATLGVLATAGVEFCLPAVYCEESDLLESVKEKFEEERLDYLDYLSRHLQEIHTSIANKEANVEEIYDFASLKVSPELKIRARKFEVSVNKADEKTKRGVLMGLKDMVPSIGSSLAEGKGLKGSVTRGVLSAFFGSLFQSEAAYREMRAKHPEAAYIYNIQKQLET